MQNEVFPLHWALKCARSSQICVVPNWFTRNQTMWSQTKACITKSSCINKRLKRAQLKLTDTILVFGTLSNIYFLKKYDVSEASSASVFRQRSTEAGGPIKLSYSQSLGTIQTVFIFAPCILDMKISLLTL